jgi:penicillin amidase
MKFSFIPKVVISLVLIIVSFLIPPLFYTNNNGILGSGSYGIFSSEEINIPNVNGEIILNPIMITIKAQDNYSLFFLDGYVQARERLFQMEVFGLLASGNLSSWFGSYQNESDYLVHLLGIPQVAQEEINYLKEKYPDYYDDLVAFSKGVNYYISQSSGNLPFEFKALNVKPYNWSPYYTLAWAKYMGWTLTSGALEEMLSSLAYYYLGYNMTIQVFPYYPYFWKNITSMPGCGNLSYVNLSNKINSSNDIYTCDGFSSYYHYIWNLNWYNITGIRNLSNFIPLIKRALKVLGVDPLINFKQYYGSNAFAVRNSSLNQPILAGDPHLALLAPSLWLPLRLINQWYNVSGWALICTPGILIGQNNYVAWSLTTPEGASSNAFIQPVNNGKYFYNGNWFDIVNHTYIIRTLSGQFTINVSFTNLGTILYTYDNYALVLNWVGQMKSLELVSLLKFDTAKNVFEFINDLKYWSVPPQNFIVVDKENIAYYLAGKYPIISAKLPNGSSIKVIGGRGVLNYSFFTNETVPFELLPHSINPPSGFLFDPNQPTAGIYYPYPFIGGFWDDGGRAYSIYSTLSNSRNYTIKTIMALQSNVTDYWASKLTPILLKALKNTNITLYKQIYNYLNNWNYSFYQNLVQPTIYWYWVSAIYNLTFSSWYSKYNLTLPYPQVDVVIYLANHYPTSQWFYGNFSRIVLKALNLSLSLLQKYLGNNISQWQWGKVHQLLIGSISVPNFSLGPYPEWGDSYTVSVGSVPLILDFPLPYVTSGSSLRIICSPGKVFIGNFPGGIAENPGSDIYSTQLNYWLNFKYYNFYNSSINNGETISFGE